MSRIELYIKDLGSKDHPVRKYGTDRHDSLVISEDGRTLSYYNLQNGDGSEYGDYRFCDADGLIPEEDEDLQIHGAVAYANIGGFEMTKLMEIDIDLTPEDIVEYIINADSQEQSAILYKLSKVHYNEVGKFIIQLQAVVDDIKNSYNHDIQNNIKRMVDDLQGYICEEDLK